MTEEEWLDAITPSPMLEFLRGRSSDRKLRLFAVACCRRVQSLVVDRRGSSFLDLAERLADGLLSNSERRTAATAVNDRQEGGAAAMSAWGSVCCSLAVSSAHAAERCCENAANAHGFASTSIRYTPTWGDNSAYFAQVREGARHENLAQTALLREVFGNPFRTITADPRLQTEMVVALANTIYTNHAFDRMPSLADVLEEASCDNADILSHCRVPGQHVRGCWVVDLVLGKE